MSHLLNATQFRAEFPSLTDSVHLASCSQGALSSRLAYALQEIGHTLRDRGAPWEAWMAEVGRARERFARLIGAEPGEVAVLSCASEAAFQAASSLDWSRRPGIVTTDLEFPSIAHAWLAQRGRGATVRVAADTGEYVPAEAYERVVDESVNLVSVPLHTYRNGARLPVEDVVRLAHAKGARVFVDAYQGAGVTPIDVERLGCDYLAAGSLKYLLGLPGIAFLYVRGGIEHQREPELTGWFGRTDPFAFDPRLLDFPEDARRFETGTPPIPSAYAANAGFDLIERIDLAAVDEHVSALVEELAQRLAAAGERVASPAEARGPQVAIADDDPARLAARLAERRIWTAPRGDLLRLSLHYYNDRSDVDSAVEAISACRRA
ncbi:aminotransferase class V-fold PLP-dependent enzyme [Nonomuraea sp. KC401]|uniref:aminotransferase class V-fold PLP-dependent enzyme n=1 Tax=unclassified Nonomuraea TaxID=2593643 RepID=UPI0010FDBF99|nr:MULTISPECIES: aminotransferase class V-fold PLP-dependent enzyme [unclassified Nonomuraea]NBE99602.1 aminotransferase class V-fold PLP-dependent enzyme [Nonomuraea sp. K271]TLF56775.1 aminotransferase class V-fold PLP-dependent enzyme [Nonomuraea sp. KC401]